MSIKYAILGFLSWSPLSGYDLKKKIAEVPTHYWSGNNNQIYRTLVALHREGLASLEVIQQEDAPARKVYAITEAGLADLRQWLLAPSPLPELKDHLLIQLAWAEPLTDEEMDTVLADYEARVHAEVMLLGETMRRGPLAPQRSPRESYVWQAIYERWLGFHQAELDWVRQVRSTLQAGITETK